MKRILIACTFLLSFIGSACAGLDSLFYLPDDRVYATPARDGYTYEEVTFTSSDGTRLSGWFIPATGEAMGTVIHFHGNAQNMTAHYSYVSWLPANGFNLFVFDYRGYGKSEGSPTRKGVYEDCVAAVKFVQARSDIDPERLILFGQSIGGANAIAVQGNNRFSGVVGVATDSAFSTYKRVAGDHAGWLKPLAYCLISNRLSPEKSVSGIAPVPLLIIHGTSDTVVPYKHAGKLFEAAAEPKEMWGVPGGRHTDALGTHFRTFAPRLHLQFIKWIAESQKPEDEAEPTQSPTTETPRTQP